ncbi:hypothetical protein [Flavobacterium sp. 102]|uniref:hypothetical protein n=1 Tax=Flavobacterium sp. 102 TaxID=2135623 RepID=UPI000EAD74D6|nr:hypothetical protein [Flavobacterium sp. 102]RKS02884.1 hypothetical protein C8C84_2614 [Flavobacterium sp. 102]
MSSSIIGFHGTSFDSAKSIVKGDFEISKGNAEWIGDGAYFFIEGISKVPNEQAEQWAIAQAWDNKINDYKYKDISVIKSEITVEDDRLLDLTTSDGVEILLYILEQHEKKILRIRKSLSYLDGLIINFARGEGLLDIDVAKGNFYIKFAKERVYKIDLRTANCTICSVFNPKKNLQNNTIISNKKI